MDQQKENQTCGKEVTDSMRVITRKNETASSRFLRRGVVLVFSTVILTVALLFGVGSFLLPNSFALPSDELVLQPVDTSSADSAVLKNVVGSPSDETLQQSSYGKMRDVLLQNATLIDETKGFDGGTMELSALAIDDSFVNAILRISYIEPVDLSALNMPGNPLPEWVLIRLLLPRFEMYIDGKTVTFSENIALNNDFRFVDAYFSDPSTLEVMLRRANAELLGDDYTFELKASSIPVVDGDTGEILVEEKRSVLFSLASVDSSSQAGKTAEPQIYSPGTDGIAPLDIMKLSLSPVGSSITVRGNSGGDAPLEQGELDRYMIQDDLGNDVHAFLADRVGEREVEVEALSPKGEPVIECWPVYDAAVYVLTGIDPGAKSLSFTPLLYDREAAVDYELKTVDLSVVGTEFNTNPLGGFRVEDYRVQGSKVSLCLEPFGILPTDIMPEFVPNDLDLVPLTKDKRTAVSNRWIDEFNRNYCITWDYYNASESELSTLHEFQYHYFSEIGLGEKTVPLTVALS